uniref:Uncharacterized protein n=1 Tax=Anguilla anguilla TaxID=7936 RepID=A0A0E9XII4_ANGAN
MRGYGKMTLLLLSKNIIVLLSSVKSFRRLGLCATRFYRTF